MFEPAQQKKDSPTDGEPSNRYPTVKLQHEHSNIHSINCVHSFDTICYIMDFISYPKQLNSIENNLNVFQYETMDLNKFWLKYFGVVNLSDHKCTFLELSVLGKGLKFCLTPPKYCNGKLKESIDKFFQSASLKAYFKPHGPEDPESILVSSFLSENDAEPEIFEHKDLKCPSTFNPQMPSNLEYVYNVLIDRILSDCPELNRRRNLTIKQFKALTDLKENKSIMIKKADKRF